MIFCVQFDCSVDTGDDFLLLNGLVNKQSNYIAQNVRSDDVSKDTIFYINFCAPLNPIPGTPCPAGSGACAVAPSGTPMVGLLFCLFIFHEAIMIFCEASRLVVFQSLGRMKSEPVWNSDESKVVAKYIDGDTCPDAPAMRLSADVTFICVPGPNKVQSSFCDLSFKSIL